MCGEAVLGNAGQDGQLPDRRVCARGHRSRVVSLGWPQFFPESWDDTCADTNEDAEAIAARRVKTQIPDNVRHRPKWELALEMLDELASWGHRPPLICADAGYGEASPFRTGLTVRGIPYVVAVKSSTSAHLAEAVPALKERGTGPGKPPATLRY